MSTDCKYIQLIISNRAFTLIELMITIAILSLLIAIAVPNYISYRSKAYCTQAESDANYIGAAIADYFSISTRRATPTVSNLNITLENFYKILGVDPNIHITIQVTDHTSRCPLDYQAATPGWDSNYVFTKEIR